MRVLLTAFCAAALLVSPAWADSVDYVFGFEEFDAGIVTDSVETSLDGAFGTIILRVERPGSVFTFSDLSPWSVANGFATGVRDSWGTRSLDPFVDMINPQAFVFTAIVPVGYAVLNTSIENGDFGPSDYDEISFDGELGFLDNNEEGFYRDELFTTLTWRGIPNAWFRGDLNPPPPPPGPIYTFTGSGGGPSEPMSLFWDNLVLSIVAVDDLPQTSVAPALPGSPNSEFGPGYLPDTSPPASPIPEPGSLALLGAGLAAFALWRRRQR